GQQVRLDDVASVTDSFAERSSIAYLDGKPVVAVEIKRSNGFSYSSVAADVDEAMKQFAAKHSNVQIDDRPERAVGLLDLHV
ncbi:efflux RND transporter permease subunit, partial [Rhizobium ruizarguesonis]